MTLLAGAESSVRADVLEFELRWGAQRARVARRGAALLGYAVAGHDVVDGGRAGDVPAAFDGAVLAPWPGRVRDAMWRRDGVTHALPINEPATGAALHGLVHVIDWTPTFRSAWAVTLSCWLHAQPGYPYELRLGAAYELTDAGLRCTLAAANVGAEAAPFGCGAHPYVGHTGTRVDDMTLHLPARTRLVVDERLLPVGRAAVAGTPLDFGGDRRLAGVRLDTTFTDVRSAADGTTRALVGTPHGVVQLWADESFPWWQVYTSDGFDAGHPRHRRSLAVEPMTCPPDAFNSGEGLILLAPGATWRGSWGISVTR
jgi:aldose 1-epimerase